MEALGGRGRCSAEVRRQLQQTNKRPCQRDARRRKRRQRRRLPKCGVCQQDRRPGAGSEGCTVLSCGCEELAPAWLSRASTLAASTVRFLEWALAGAGASAVRGWACRRKLGIVWATIARCALVDGGLRLVCGAPAGAMFRLLALQGEGAADLLINTTAFLTIPGIFYSISVLPVQFVVHDWSASSRLTVPSPPWPGSLPR